ncbi:hydroxymethylglutaryl-CoA lyase [Muricoccus aerilatus]|uniref:hydroxymethylglutaryl-CoA lyase n=1 Tax=Muricoccus aerilatus TaxID=452982 RepID=UPI0005C17EE5|nr:hydroxymethylglutaryl-CoA lyase [Roseomonas aerilata]
MRATIIEVAPRDGFQPISPFIPTDEKVALIEAAHAAGLRRIEIGSFVNPAAVPQMRDAAEVLRRTAHLPGLDAQVLVPNARGVALALAAGARHLVYVISASEPHNRSNVRRDVETSIAEYGGAMVGLPEGVRVRLNLATAFDCPFDGRMEEALVLDRLDRILAHRPDVEVGLCDTTGRADPDHVHSLASACLARWGGPTRWVFHGHDTYGLGLANAAAAWRAGIRDFDAAFGGLGGCPFAPGATGNTATEDLVWMLHRMGTRTGIDLPRLLTLANRAAALPGASPGGRVRAALGWKAAA